MVFSKFTFFSISSFAKFANPCFFKAKYFQTWNFVCTFCQGCTNVQFCEKLRIFQGPVFKTKFFLIRKLKRNFVRLQHCKMIVIFYPINSAFLYDKNTVHASSMHSICIAKNCRSKSTDILSFWPSSRLCAWFQQRNSIFSNQIENCMRNSVLRK